MSTLLLNEKLPASQAGLLHPGQRFRFLAFVLAGTWVPLTFFCYLGFSEPSGLGVDGLKIALLFAGAIHVQATFFFYTDPAFRPLIKINRGRFIYFPVGITACSTLFFLLLDQNWQIYAFLFYWAWQNYHYGRQNVGLYAFSLLGQTVPPAAKTERLLLELSVICGVLGTFFIFSGSALPSTLGPVAQLCYKIGFYGLVLINLAGLMWQAINITQITLARSVFFFTSLLFFFPLYLSTNHQVYFFSYAIAHGLQYLIFMTYVALGTATENGSPTHKNLVKFIAVTLIIGFACYNAAGLRGFSWVQSNYILNKGVDAAVGLVYGLTMAHFVVDAGAWRLSRAEIRAYMSKPFGFMGLRQP